MKKITIYIILILIYSLLAIQSIFAETGYVSDMLILSLKDGPGRQYNTIKTLRSNTQVDIVETTERFLKIRTQEGDEGWVESQYITKELPKILIIEQLNAKIAQLEGTSQSSENIDIKRDIKRDIKVDESQINNKINNKMDQIAPNKEVEYLNKIKSLEAALNTQLEKNRQLETQLRSFQSQLKQTNLDVNQNSSLISNGSVKEEDIYEINDEHEKNFADKVEEEEASMLEEWKKDMIVLPEDDVLKTAMIKWFCAGAGVLIAGWFIGRSFSAGRRRGRGGLFD